MAKDPRRNKDCQVPKVFVRWQNNLKNVQSDRTQMKWKPKRATFISPHFISVVLSTS